MLLDFFVMLALRVHESVEFVGLGLLFNLEGEAALHLVQHAVDRHELFEEVRACEDQVLRQILPGAVVESFAHVALPEAEDLAKEVVLEEFHARQHIEHG